MLQFELASPERGLKILCIGAHCDDIEIGCGGTILKLTESRRQIEIYWLVLTSTPARKLEALACANLFLQGVNEKKIVIEDFRDGFLPYEGARVKEYFENLKREFSPDLIFTHYRHDLHQDHRLICELTWNTFRNHLILEYEIPKYDGDLGSPNFFAHLTESTCRRKIDSILECYQSQKEKPWFTNETFQAMSRLRGNESGAVGILAEAFYCRKICL
ncbi:PIG-L domain-containing protein [candidate division KSB1 bacterium]|nr:MAG: PIG-L domain-containing protein [candidate division KSB1 bacterium]